MGVNKLHGTVPRHVGRAIYWFRGLLKPNKGVLAHTLCLPRPMRLREGLPLVRVLICVSSWSTLSDNRLVPHCSSGGFRLCVQRSGL